MTARSEMAARPPDSLTIHGFANPSVRGPFDGYCAGNHILLESGRRGDLLVDLNTRPFKRLPGSWASANMQLQRPALNVRPLSRYEFAPPPRGATS
jgi:hypothetical protein